MANNWKITEAVFEPEELLFKETLFTIGNGYLGTRGVFEEGYPNEQAATLIHGVFDDVPLVYTELANTPNWVRLELLINGQRFRMDSGKIHSYRRSLDLSNGVLSRRVRWESPSGEQAEILFERFASLADEHLLAVQLQVRALNFDGEIEIRASLPGYTDNNGWVHWNLIDQGSLGEQSAFLRLSTKETHLEVAEACHLTLPASEAALSTYWDSTWVPTLVAHVAIEQGQEITAQKLVSVYTQRDTGQPEQAAVRSLAQAVRQGYETLRGANDRAWQAEWETSNVNIIGDEEADRSLRYNLFQLLIAAPRRDERVSIAAKTLSGFGYRGHVFWDTEIFVLPFFIFTQPAIARNLLLYRYHTLPGARQKAAENGLEGAMFAWESAATGKETTPRWVPGPGGLELIRIWCGDIELHISADIAYAVMQYWQVTGDDDFMRDYGAEIVLDTARFWGSRAEWNAEKGVYEILNVIGPDEYHDHVDNNAFTNNLARWNLQAAQRVLEWLQHEVPQKAGELVDALDLSPQRLEHWQDVIDKLALGFNPDTGLFEQFEGFYDRKAVDLDEFEPRQKSLQALLGIAGVQEYQILKQPDVLMLLYLLRSQYNSEILRSNWEFYTPRTDLSYGSSLGPAIHAILAVETGHVERGYRHFMHAASTDLTNARGNSQDGIHAATAGGLWQAAIFGFGGLRLGSEGLNVEAHLPVEWQRLQFKIRYRGKIYAYNLNRRSASAGQNPRMATGVPQPAFPIQGAIFDLDGVLTDTSELHYQAWKRLADEEGLPFNRKDNEALRGIPRRESLLLILKGRELPEEKIQELMRRKNHYYQESIQNLTPGDLLPGAPQFLRDVRSNGVKIAIGSASKNARAVIDKLGIGSLIDAISDGNSVNRQKPAPDLFLHAASQLSVEPHHCVVFEDAESGVAAALAGGMWAVGIGPQSRVGEAHLVISGLNEVTWPDLLERLQVHLEQPQGL